VGHILREEHDAATGLHGARELTAAGVLGERDCVHVPQELYCKRQGAQKKKAAQQPQVALHSISAELLD
jgi:hypothetical protein